MQDDPELLDLMLADQEGQPAIYKPGPYWRGYQLRTARALRRFGLGDFRNRPGVGKGYADVDVREPDWNGAKAAFARLPKLRSLFGDWRRVVDAQASGAADYARRFYDVVLPEARELDGIDTLHAGGAAISFRGRPTAALYLEQVLRLRAIPVDYSAVRTVMEIGGGFGAWVHTLLSARPNVRKVVYLDIPPILYVGTQYLRSFFPAAVIDYRATRGRERIAFSGDDRLEIVCLCPWQIERLEASVDVFWNAASFSEMTREIVTHYGAKVSGLLADGAQIGLLPNAPEESSERHAGLLDIKAAFPFAEFVEIDCAGRLYLYGRQARRP